MGYPRPHSQEPERWVSRPLDCAFCCQPARVLRLLCWAEWVSGPTGWGKGPHTCLGYGDLGAWRVCDKGSGPEDHCALCLVLCSLKGRVDMEALGPQRSECLSLPCRGLLSSRRDI